METVQFARSLEIEAGKPKLIPENVSVWWKTVSKEANSGATPGKLYAIGNYLVELAKNSLGDGNRGRITTVFDDEKVKLVIEDFGASEKEINLNIAGDFGLKESLEYFDIFTMEAKGRKYEKNNHNLLEEVDDSDLRTGSRVTLIKYHVAPVDEYEQEYHSHRNFSNRM